MSFNVNNSLYSLPRISQAPNWVRPADWINITNTDNQVQALVNDTGQGWISFTTTFTSGETCYVDWGDGVIQTSTTSPFRADHYYTPGTGTTCSRGYTTFNVKIYVMNGSSPSTIQSCRFTDTGGLGAFSATASNGSSLQPAYSVGLLEMYYGENTQTTGAMSGYFSANDTTGGGSFFVANFNQLEYVRMPRVLASAALYQMFEGCINLYKVDMPKYITGNDTTGSMFLNCFNLQEVNFPTEATSWGITQMDNTFSNCYNLRKVTMPPAANLANCTVMSGVFNNCYSLQSIDMPELPKVTNFSTMFSNCVSLKSFVFKSLPVLSTLTAINFTNMFTACRALESVIFPTTWSSSSNANVTATTMFSNCSNLVDVVIPVFSFGTMNSMFLNCSLLQSVRFGTSAYVGTPNLSNMFQNCFSLQKVELPTMSLSGSSVANMAAVFSGCQTLSNITIPFNCGAMTQTFLNCVSLISADLSACSSVTSLNALFSGCSELKSVILPSSLSLVTDFTSMFLGCLALEEFTIPNTLVATNYTTMFSGCRSLRKAIFGTVGTGAFGFAGMFTSCGSLTEIDFSAFNSSSLITSSLTTNFNNCHALKKITLPSVQWTLMSAPAGAAFGFCPNLTTIVNFDKLGSTSTSGTIINWVTQNVFNGASQIVGLTFSCRNGAIAINGTSTQKWNLQNLRLTNTGTGQWTGTSPQINISYTKIGYTALVQLFNDMAAQGTVTTKTINITGCDGAASLTSADRLIVTSKGWTITG